MGDNNISADGEDYKSSLKFAQSPLNQQKTQVDENSLDHSYLNNSLVFYNEDSKLHLNEKDNIFDYRRDKKGMEIIYDATDSNQNNTSIRLQNSPIETPFLDKLKDPFDETDEITKSEMSTPFSYRYIKEQNDTNSIKFTVGKKYKTFNSPSDFGVKCTQGDRSNQTFNFLLRDTQDFNNQSEDTQLIHKDRYSLNNDTQLIKNSQLIKDTQLINSKTQKNNQDTQVIIKDTQVINKDTQIIIEDAPLTNIENQSIYNNNIEHNKDTQIIQDYNNYYGKYTQRINNDTQVINNEIQKNKELNNHNGTQFIHTVYLNGNQNEDTIKTPIQSKIIGNAIQIPSTVEVKAKSHREVVNTQEETDASFSGTSPYSQRQEVNTEEIDEEVQTDEENNDYVLSSSAEVPYDDSLLTYKLPKRKPSVEYIPTSSPKSNKFPKVDHITYSDDDTSTINITKQKEINNPIIIDSPNEIEESSPVLVKKSDLLKVVTKSSPFKNDNYNFDVSSVTEKSYIPSSPRKEDNCGRNGQVVTTEKPKGERSDNTADKTSPICNEIILGSEDIEMRHNKSQNTEISISCSQKNNYILRSEEDAKDNNIIKYPENVWASFNFKMCTGRIKWPGKQFSIVEFEEGSYEIKNDNLFSLDIRIGDTVRTKSSRAQFIITGLTCRSSKECIRCIRGYDTVLLKKCGRKSRKTEEISVELNRCYMEISDWVKHQQRMERTNDFEKFSGLKFKSDILETPKRGNRHYLLSNSDINRAFVGPFSSPVKVNDNLIANVDFNNNKTFSGMVFCITSIDGERKQNLMKVIKENGGIIIDEGINDVVEFILSDSNHLALSSEKCKDFNFFAMISNSCCRSAKYLQALALGWPILSDTFIYNCIKNRNEINNWSVYLLPAGYSNYLNTTKSLETYQFRKNYEKKLKLSEQCKINCSLLENFRIVIFKPKLNQITLETCKFIFHAFGAKSLVFCDTLKVLKQNIKSIQGEKLIIYDDGEEAKENLLKINNKESGFEVTNNQKKKLPTRTTRASIKAAAQREEEVKKTCIKIGLVNWEWVVQCTISTYIWEPDYITVKLT